MLCMFQSITRSCFSKLVLPIVLMISALAACQNFQQSTVIPTSTFQPEIPPWQKPVGNNNILPAPLYFVSTKTAEDGQPCSLGSYEPHIVRIERDGHTRTIITPCHIDGGINGFDVSPIDNAVVFVAQGSMWIIDEKSETPRLLVVSSPNPEYPDRQSYNMRNPKWSPDGTKIAYEDGGVRILKITTGEILAVTDDLCTAKGGDLLFEIDPCQYRGAYRVLQWSPDSKSLLVLVADEDSRILVIYTFDDTEETFSSYEVNYHAPWTSNGTIAWGIDGSNFLIDQFEKETEDQNAGKYALWRISRDGSNSQLVWAYEERHDFLSLNNISERADAYNLLETADSRILFSLSSYLVELTPNNNSVQARIITKIKGFNAWGWRWYQNGEYAVFRSESGNIITDSSGNTIGYSGKQYIGVIEIETGQVYLVADEDVVTVPSYSEIWEANHLVWGSP